MAALAGAPDVAAADRALYLEQGFLVLRSVFPADEAAALRRHLLGTLGAGSDKLRGALKTGSAGTVASVLGIETSGEDGQATSVGAGGGSVVYHTASRGIDPENPAGLEFVQGSNQLGDEWLALSVDERLVAPAAAVLGSGDLNMHHQKCSLKPPRFRGGHGGGGGFHKDDAYLLEDPADALVTILLQLDSTGPGRGSTRVCPGSHLREYLPAELKPDLGIRRDVIGDGFVDCPLGPGDALLIHPSVVHSVGDNGGDSTLVSLLVCYKRADAVDVQPGGNKRSLAELPVARGGWVCPLFPEGYAAQLAARRWPPPVLESKL
eukprot:SAG22_NODE_118_length_19263_cov_16.155813_2_plen_321_part_00